MILFNYCLFRPRMKCFISGHVILCKSNPDVIRAIIYTLSLFRNKNVTPELVLIITYAQTEFVYRILATAL